MSNKTKVLIFGAGGVFDKFISSGDADSYHILGVLDNHRTGEIHGISIHHPNDFDFAAIAFDQIVLAIWDNPQSLRMVIDQLLHLGVSRNKIAVYSYDRHIVSGLQEARLGTDEASGEDILTCFYDLNTQSETFDITSLLVVADCAREERELSWVRLVVVARDQQCLTQAYCIDDAERSWRSDNIIRQAVSLLPTCKGVTFCSHRHEAQSYIDNARATYPDNYQLDMSMAIQVNSDFVDWYRKGLDPRRLQASAKAVHYNQMWQQQSLPDNFSDYITVTLRESTLQPKRNSNLPEWFGFFRWLQVEFPHIAVVIIRDTEKAFEPLPEQEANVFVHPVAPFHMDLRMALYEGALLNMGCSNGPKQLCHLSATAPYITTKMIVEDYLGTSTEKFKSRNIELGQNFEFAGEAQLIDWNTDNETDLIASFMRFQKIVLASESH